MHVNNITANRMKVGMREGRMAGGKEGWKD